MRVKLTDRVHLGEHPTLCRSCQGNSTLEHAKVTCPRCIKQIRALGLVDRSTLPYRPTIKMRCDDALFVGHCPSCGSKLVHGVGDGTGGHRVAHCGCWPDGYYITETNDGQ